MIKNLPANAGDINDTGLIPGSGRYPGGEYGYPLQYSCLENPMDRGAWQATVHGVTKSQTRLKRLSTHAWGSRAEIITVRIWFEGQADRTAGGLDVGSQRKGKRGQDDSDVSAQTNQKDGAAIVSRCLSFLMPSI